MNTTTKSLGIAVFGSLLLLNQGCSMKWLQSEGEEGTTRSAQKSRNGPSSDHSESLWRGQGVNPNFPEMAQAGTRDDLSGFSRNPFEERLTPGVGIVSKLYADKKAAQRAELTQEEKAAIEAGLQDVFFSYDQWTLSESGMEALNHNAKWLKEHPGAVMKVEGHCDERGTTDYNVVLGEKRSKSARAYLLELGVGQRQVGTVSYGKERPFCLDHNESCYQQNRRGHMLLRAKK